MSLADHFCADEVAQVFAYRADALSFLRTLPDAYVHTIITDPPYGLGDAKPDVVAAAITAWATGDRERVPDGRGFMGRRWDAFVPPPAVWDECLRVLKPGGHLAVFAGSRTADLMGLSIRLAGFDMRDGISAWLYGSGFPKSLDIGKAIDKAGGGSPVEHGRILREARERSGLSRQDVVDAVGCTLKSVIDWEQGRSRNDGEVPEVCTPSPAYRAKLADLLGYTADERRIAGVGRKAGPLHDYGHGEVLYGPAATDAARAWSGWGTALKPAHEPILIARKPLAGTVAANTLAHGCGGLNVDATRVSSPCPACGAHASERRSPRGSERGTPAGPSACSTDDSGPGHESGPSDRTRSTLAPRSADARPERRTDPLASGAGHDPTRPSPRDSLASCPTSPRSDGERAPSAGVDGRGDARPRPDALGCPGPRGEPARSPSETRSTACPECTARDVEPASSGRWPTNVVLAHAPELDPVTGEVVGDACADGCVPGCHVAALDEQSVGTRAAKPARSGSAGKPGAVYNRPVGSEPIDYGDSGGASRFYPTFRYTAKAGKRERPQAWGAHPDCTCDPSRPLDPETGALPPWHRRGTVCATCERPATYRGHPTVKPQGLLEWLVALLTPTAEQLGEGATGTVLDPFAGSGSLGQAARTVGVGALLVERDVHSARLIAARLGVDEPRRDPAVPPLQPFGRPLPEIAPEVELDDVLPCPAGDWPRDPLDVLLCDASVATSVAELRVLAKTAVADGLWTDDVRAVFTARRLEIEGVAA